MEVHFSPDQQAQLDQLAAHAGIDTAGLVQAAALKLVDENAAFRAAVREGLAQANLGQCVEDQEVAAWLLRQESR